MKPFGTFDAIEANMTITIHWCPRCNRRLDVRGSRFWCNVEGAFVRPVVEVINAATKGA